MASNNSSDEVLGTLNILGLTRLQARIYLHLLLNNEQSARFIVESLRVDRVEVYRALQSLQSLGLVEVDLGNPNRYAACPHDAALKLLLDKKEKEFDAIRTKTLHVEKMLSQVAKKQNKRKQEVSSDQFYTLKRGYSVVDTILEVESTARTEIRKVVNSLGMGYHLLFGVSDLEKKLVQSGVKIRLVTDNRTRALRAYSKIVSVKYAGDISNSLRYIIVDERAIVLSMAPNRTDEKDSIALLTNNDTLIHALSSFYDESWDSLRQ